MMNKFTDRMVRAAKLDVRLYEEVEADKTAMGSPNHTISKFIHHIPP